MPGIAVQDLVQRLLILEAAENQEHSVGGAVERILDKLRAHLTQRIGQEGVRTLLTRALTLAAARFSQLSAAVKVGADGSLAGLRDAADSETAAALVVCFLELLITFIGKDLTLRLLGAVWPAITLDDAPNGEDKRL